MNLYTIRALDALVWEHLRDFEECPPAGVDELTAKISKLVSNEPNRQMACAAVAFMYAKIIREVRQMIENEETRRQVGILNQVGTVIPITYDPGKVQ